MINAYNHVLKSGPARVLLFHIDRVYKTETQTRQRVSCERVFRRVYSIFFRVQIVFESNFVICQFSVSFSAYYGLYLHIRAHSPILA